jgi:hypothetical protein
MVEKKLYYKYISKVLYTIFGTRRRKGERFGFDPPPGVFFGLREMICLFPGSGVMVRLLLVAAVVLAMCGSGLGEWYVHGRGVCVRYYV